jgi:hypothetical protein
MARTQSAKVLALISLRFADHSHLNPPPEGAPTLRRGDLKRDFVWGQSFFAGIRIFEFGKAASALAKTASD